MRIVVLGDFHLMEDSIRLTSEAMEDVARCKPDLVVALGDYGLPEHIGSVTGLREAKAWMDLTGAPVRPILGNHDLQRESGKGRQQKRTMEREMMALFQLDSAYGTMEYEDFRLFFINCEPQPEDSCFSLQECYITDNQFDWIVRELERRPGIPALFFTHAPPIGSGIRTAPHRMHVKSTNAYLDQNHDPYRWQRLFQTYPEIILWFSAHFHLGHHYPDSQTVRSGTHFFNTGVHGTCTRDQQRLSRIIDIDASGLEVLTLDHGRRQISSSDLFRHPKKISTWMTSTNVMHSMSDAGQDNVQMVAACSSGDEPAAHGGIVTVDRNKFIISALDGHCWEVVPESEAVMGSLHGGPALHASTVSKQTYWMAWGRFIGATDLNDPQRFIRTFECDWPMSKAECEEPILALAPHPEHGVWAATARHVYHTKSVDNIGRLQPSVVLSRKTRQMISNRNGIWILDIDGTLWRWDGMGDLERVYHGRNIYSFDVWQNNIAMLAINRGRAQVHLMRENETEKVSTLDMHMEAGESDRRIVCLDRGHWLVMVNRKAWLGSGDVISYHLDPGSGSITDIARAEDRFVVCRAADNAYERPRFELYRY